jgi:glycosyltransferase involved in cell wall biosynthesis
MNILFVHSNFPAQYQFIARELARDPQMRIVAIGSSTAQDISGVHLVRYSLPNVDVSTTHPFARRFDLECHRAEQVLYALSSLASSGFTPDVIMAHPGWGETLPLRTIFPASRILLYCEFFYGVQGRDVGFDPEFPETGIDGHVALHLKNATTLFALADCDVGISPSAWQRSTFPQEYQRKISVIHEGIDADTVKPNANAVLRLPNGRLFRRTDEVVTFVARNLEPVRGYHIFMRALPRILAERPRAQVVVIGGDGVSYGASAPQGTTWKKTFFEEVADKIDQTRVHFAGRLSYPDLLSALQISSAHVYLTYPFVLSWSVLEAMSVGCMVIGSSTAPVQEVINEKNGLLVPFFDSGQLADRVIEVLTYPRRFDDIRARARQTILDQYDLTRICLPKMTSLIRSVLPPIVARSER